MTNIRLTSQTWENAQEFLPTFLEGFNEYDIEKIEAITGIMEADFTDEYGDFEVVEFIEKVEAEAKVINRQVEVTAFYNETIRRYDLKASIEFIGEFENGTIETYTDQDELYQHAEAIEIWEKENDLIWTQENARKVVEAE